MIRTVKGKYFNNNKIYYKVTNEAENHHRLQYHDGLNEDPISFNYSVPCSAGGIYFTDIKNIFIFLSYGIYIREITVPDDALVYKETNKYKADKLIFGKRMDINSDTIKYLIDNGADIHVSDDYVLSWTAEEGHLDIMRYLVENGMDIHADNDYVLKRAAENGHLDIMMYLVKNGADSHAGADYALRWAANNGHINVVKYLVENGANIHVSDDAAVRSAANNGHINVVKYLVENGADIHAGNDYVLGNAAFNGHLDIVEYIKSL